MVVGWRTLVATLAVGAVALVGLPPGNAQTPPEPEVTTPEGWLPHPLPTPAVPKVAFIGDSIGRDARDYIFRRVGRTHSISYFNAVGAGYIGYHQYHSNLMARLRAAGGPDILLVELGTGDAFWDHSAQRFEGDIRRFLDAVLPYVTCVRWFDQKPTANIAYPYVNEHRLEFNRILGRVLAEPEYADRNVALVSYAAWSNLAGEQRYFLGDRLHHNQAGRRELGILAGQAVEGCDPATTSGPFWDVPDRSGLAPAVAWLAEAGVAEPYRNGAFRARLGSFEVPTNRGQVADFLWRLVGSPSGPNTTWSDVPRTLRKAAGWVEAEGIMRGYENGTFAPSGAVTRAALATYLWRVMDEPTEGVTPRGWTDVAPGLTAGVDWAVASGVMTAPSGTVFGDNRPATRAEAAKALYALGQLLSAFAASVAGAPTTPSTTTPSTTAPPTTVPPTSSVPPILAPDSPTASTTLPPPTTLPATTAPAAP